MKLMYRDAFLLACSLGMILVLTGCYQVSVSFEDPSKPETETTLPPSTQSSQIHKTESSSAALAAKTAPSAVPTTKNFASVPHHHSSSKELHEGTLRMSNQTEQPVRLILLARAGLKGSTSEKTSQNVPAHWDFAPKEGSDKGLLLSLPNSNLKLEKGDILVAFAQDGSSRYWGPYVVDETSLPIWNTQKREWQLVLSQ